MASAHDTVSDGSVIGAEFDDSGDFLDQNQTVIRYVTKKINLIVSKLVPLDNREGWFHNTIRIWQAVDNYDAFWERTFRQI